MEINNEKIEKNLEEVTKEVEELSKTDFKQNRISYKSQRTMWGVIFLSPWIIGFLIFFLQPLVVSLYYSFHEVKPTPNGLEMTFVGLSKYTEALFEDATFGRVLFESTLNTILDIPVLLIFSLLVAVLLNTQFKGRAIARALFFVPVIFNSAAISSALGGGEMLRDILEQSGVGALSKAFDMKEFLIRANMNQWFVNFISGTIGRIYIIISFSGVQILIFLAGIQSIPKHLYEAARIEGATSYELFWKITLPMVSPLILTTTVYSFVDSFMRSPVNGLMTTAFNSQNYGLNASMSWIYFVTTISILGLSLFFINLGVFYYDE